MKKFSLPNRVSQYSEEHQRFELRQHSLGMMERDEAASIYVADFTETLF